MAHGSDETGKRHNRLIKEKSPYLLQHAEDPVDCVHQGTKPLRQLSTLETITKGDEMQLPFL